jgi:hypothetical protein
MSIEDYQRPKTELLCPHKCGGMAFIIYTDDTVKYRLHTIISTNYEKDSLW